MSPSGTVSTVAPSAFGGRDRDADGVEHVSDTIDGVKRRVRPGMGRCQGGFCGPLVLQIIAEETGKSALEIDKSAPRGELLVGAIKEVLS